MLNELVCYFLFLFFGFVLFCFSHAPPFKADALSTFPIPQRVCLMEAFHPLIYEKRGGEQFMCLEVLAFCQIAFGEFTRGPKPELNPNIHFNDA